MNYYYATLHFIVTIGVLVWLYRRHPGRYAATRLVLFATTGVALLGYYLYPLAPPRLMNGGSFIDTVHGPPDLGLDGLRQPRAHVEPVRRDAVHAHRLVAVVRHHDRGAAPGRCGCGCWACSTRRSPSS